jgi:hypothetical protein
MRTRVLVPAVLAAALAAASGCSSPAKGPGPEAVRDGSLVHKELRSYHIVQSTHSGKVGYMKVYDVTEGGGPSYRWRYVYDLDWNELGFIDQFGTAYRNKPYTPFEQDAQPRTIRVVRLPSDSPERNAMVMLGIDPALDDVSFPVASAADIGDPPPAKLAQPQAK